MEVWYVEDHLSPTLPEAFTEWLSGKTSKVFLPEMNAVKKWQEKIRLIRYSSKVKEEVELSEEFLNSLDFANKIIEECKMFSRNKNNVEILLFVNNGNVALAHFLIQQALCRNVHLENLYIVLIQNSELDATQDINYKFPDYWISRKNEASVFYAHGVITWNEVLFESICQRQQTLLVKNENYDFEYIIEWIETELCLNKTIYPSVYDFPNQNSYDHHEEGSRRGLLSIIVPYYNLGNLILETIESIRRSVYQHFEIIIVNDGSDDHESICILELIASTMNDITIVNIANEGLANARNVGAKVAKGEFIAFLDADDLIASDYYDKCIRVLNQYENVSFVYSWVQFFGLKKNIWVTFDTEFPMLLLTNMLSAFPVIRRKHFMKYGMNKVIMDRGMEDYESWISLMENACRGVSIPEPLVFYRIRANSMSRKFDRNSVNQLYTKISSLHSELYKTYGDELFKLIYHNGPGYLWNNPSVSYSELTYGSHEESITDNNQVKYELLRLANSKVGKILIGTLFRLRINKFFK